MGIDDIKEDTEDKNVLDYVDTILLCYLEFTRGVLKFSYLNNEKDETITYKATFITSDQISVETDTVLTAEYAINKISARAGWSNAFPPAVIDEDEFNKWLDRILYSI